MIKPLYGQSEECVNKLFNKANSVEDTIIILDEVDEVMKMSESDLIERIRTDIQKRIDGVERNHSIIVATTNHPQILSRPFLDRMTARIYIPKPDWKVRKEFLKKDFGHLSDSELQTIAKRTENYSIRNLTSLVKNTKEIMQDKTKNATHFLEVPENIFIGRYKPCFCQDENCPGIKMEFKEKMPGLISLAIPNMEEVMENVRAIKNSTTIDAKMTEGIEAFIAEYGSGIEKRVPPTRTEIPRTKRKCYETTCTIQKFLCITVFITIFCIIGIYVYYQYYH